MPVLKSLVATKRSNGQYQERKATKEKTKIRANTPLKTVRKKIEREIPGEISGRAYCTNSERKLHIFERQRDVNASKDGPQASSLSEEKKTVGIRQVFLFENWCSRFGISNLKWYASEAHIPKSNVCVLLPLLETYCNDSLTQQN